MARRARKLEDERAMRDPVVMRKVFRSGEMFQAKRPRRNRLPSGTMADALRAGLIVGGDPDDRPELKRALQVPMVRSVDRLSHTTLLLSRVFGWTAMLSVLNLFVAVGVSGFTQDPAFEPWVGGAFLGALYGSHFFAMAGAWLGEGYSRLGVWAVGLFWLGLLGSVPIGILFKILG